MLELLFKLNCIKSVSYLIEIVSHWNWVILDLLTFIVFLFEITFLDCNVLLILHLAYISVPRWPVLRPSFTHPIFCSWLAFCQALVFVGEQFYNSCFILHFSSLFTTNMFFFKGLILVYEYKFKVKNVICASYCILCWRHRMWITIWFSDCLNS